MSATVSTPIPADVLALAIERKADSLLPQMIELTRRVFPDLPFRVYVLEDPESADYRQIALEVKIKPDADVEAMFQANQEWTRAAAPFFVGLSWPTFCLLMV